MTTSRPSARALARSLFVIAAAGAIGFSAVAYSGARFAGPPPAPIIAVVDLEEALKGMQEKTDKEQDLKEQLDALKGRVQKLEEELANERERMKQEPDTSPNKITIAKAVREKMIRLEFEKQYSQRLLDEAQGDMLRDLYLKITRAAAEMAQSNGYSMVLASDEKAQIPAADPDTVKRTITLKRMLYVDKSMDITDQLVQKMNNDYAAGVKGGALAAPPPAKSGAASSTPPKTQPPAPKPAPKKP